MGKDDVQVTASAGAGRRFGPRREARPAQDPEAPAARPRDPGLGRENSRTKRPE
jgi:hypothetical protein